MEKTFGLCPVCGKGNLMERSGDTACDYFKSMDDKCGFIIYSSYFGREMTDKTVSDIIEKGETEVFHDFKSREGKAFSAKLILQDGYIKPCFEKEVLENACPECNDKIIVTPKAFICINHKYDVADSCAFYFSRKVAGVLLAKEMGDTLIKGEKTGLIEGFTSSKGKRFGAKLYLERLTNTEGKSIWNTRFDFGIEQNISLCPKCKAATVNANNKTFTCSDDTCGFVLWKEINGRKIGKEILLTLVENGKTDVLQGFKKRNGEVFSAKIKLSEEGKVVLPRM